jgi:hypothetical protein
MRRVCVVGLLGLLLLAARSSFGDDQAKAAKNADTHKHTTNKPATAITSVGETKGTARANSPSHLRQLSVMPDQQKVRAVMDKYASQINQLEAQLRDLKAKRDGELRVLWSEARNRVLAEVKNAEMKTEAKHQAIQQEKAKEGNPKVAPKGTKGDTQGQSHSHPNRLEKQSVKQ